MQFVEDCMKVCVCVCVCVPYIYPYLRIHALAIDDHSCLHKDSVYVYLMHAQ